jgi:hypothetical protein
MFMNDRQFDAAVERDAANADVSAIAGRGNGYNRGTRRGGNVP